MTRCRDDPRHRTRRQSDGGPPPHRDRERLLDGFFRDVDVAKLANQHGHRAAVLFAENAFNLSVGRNGHVGDQRVTSP